MVRKRQRKLIGIGIDVVDLSRAARFVRAHGSRLKSFLLPEEYRGQRRSPRPARHFALLFAAKEAASKSLGVTVHHPHAFRDYLIERKGNRLSACLSPRLGRCDIRISLHAFRAPGSLGVMALAFKS